ncbi:MAG: response regulator [Clostridiales bacterium]|jgi:putative two-component system response regulator|nr:response regulator [Clostridiales bacterium]
MANKKTILAVDDSPQSLEMIHSALGGEFSVRLAKSASLAMSALERAKADLILMDIEMPGITGFDVVDLIEKNPAVAGVPVIFVTSHATEAFVAEAVRRGAKDYIVKPYDPELLRGKVRRALGVAGG